VVNGDIVDLATAREALALSGAAAVMVGRGAQGRPWAVGQIGAALGGQLPSEAPSGPDLVALVVEHYEGVLADYGIDVGVRAARKHLDWYLLASGLSIGPERRKALMEARDPAQVIAMSEDIFGQAEREAA
jgi:tRNA-dihydrouridine synthase B